jgi:eukaryotic-like serine/threonine-protein kinase
MSTGPEFDDSKRLASEQVAPVPSATAARRTARRSRLTAMVVILSVAAIAIVSALLWSRRYPPSQPNAVRLSLGLPPGVTLQRNWHPFEQMAVSRDGEMLAFSATDASGQSSLWIRPLGSAEARKMDQTEGALLPFWSPDSQFVGFWAGGKLKKIRRTGGLPEVICRVPEIAQGAWGTDGTILFAKAEGD